MAIVKVIIKIFNSHKHKIEFDEEVKIQDVYLPKKARETISAPHRGTTG